MKKTLIICGPYPLPEKAGTNMRTMNFARFFKNYGPVDIAYSIKDAPVENNDLFSQEYDLKKQPYPRSFQNRCVTLLSGVPYPVTEFEKTSERLLLDAIRARDYDYILVRYASNASSLFNLPERHRKKVILDFDDLFSDALYENLFQASQSRFKRMLRWVNKKLLIHFEKRCLKLGGCLFCSEEDKGRVGKSTNNRFVVPNTFPQVEGRTEEIGNGFENENTLIFVGSLNYGPNIDGLRWFINSILPEFRKQHPGGRLLVVGRSPTREIEMLCRNKAISLHPDVAELKEYYRECRAVVVPIVSGGGTRIKILEAASFGRPVLSTRKGMEGLSFRPERDLLVFGNGREFVTRYGELSNRERYESIVEHAKEIVLDNYSVSTFNRRMEKVVNGLEKDEQ
jgi:polysaccharide biosynthesis protein PslH